MANIALHPASSLSSLSLVVVVTTGVEIEGAPRLAEPNIAFQNDRCKIVELFACERQNESVESQMTGFRERNEKLPFTCTRLLGKLFITSTPTFSLDEKKTN